MVEKMNKLAVEILGERYVLKSDMSPEYVREIAQEVDARVQEILDRHSRISLSKATILAAVNLVEELRRLQENYDGLVRIIEEEKIK